jgi:poly(A) polymerase
LRKLLPSLAGRASGETGEVTVDDAAAMRQALRLTNAEYGRLQHLARSVLPSPELNANQRRIALYQMGRQEFRDAVRFAWAMDKGRFGPEAWSELIALPEHWAVPRFPLSGADLASRGVASGPKMGRLLKRLEDWWMAAGFPADKETVLAQLEALNSRQS